MKATVVVGAAGHAGVVIEALLSLQVPVAGIIAPEPAAGAFVHRIRVIGDDRFLADPLFLKQYRFVVALGNQTLKRTLAVLILSGGGRLQTIIHPRAYCASNAVIGDGAFIAAGAVVCANASVGRFTIINTGATVDHDCWLEDGVQICPGAHLAGHVVCEADAFVGTNATIVPRRTIGARAVVGAGAVVIRDVAADMTVVGNPARARLEPLLDV